MKVIEISQVQTGKYTTFSADFIFSKPFGGKKDKLIFWGKWLIQSCIYPLRAIKFGWSVRRRVWYTLPTQFASQANCQDAFFLIAFPFAIATGEDLVFEGLVSAELLAKSAQIEEYYHDVLKRKISITTTVSSLISNKKKPSKNLVAQFFTLGVDSFFTLCCHSEKSDPRMRYLLYVDGYDTPFYEKQFLNKVHKNIDFVAAKTGNKSLFIQTNIRKISDPIIGWGRYHVSALVAVGSFLGFKKLYISGESFDSPDWGLRFGADKLFSSKNQKIKFVAHAVAREEKIKKILHSQYHTLFLSFVRVCWENVGLEHLPYNCSVCQKCLKTMLILLGLGIRETPTFLPIDTQKIAKIQLVEHVFKEWQAVYKLLRENKNTDPQLLNSVQKVLEKPLRV